MRRNLLCCIPLILFSIGAWAQPCGLEDTLLILPNNMHTFNFEVFNIYNDDLSNADQGICGIELYFTHNYVENLELSISSPSGQTVQLIGPNTDDPVAFTNFARWNITFVPCGTAAQPDPGYLPQWDNDQPNNFVILGSYAGSYHPYSGCLEDFNTGPVNGTWTINVVNNPSTSSGAILGFRLLFCDERGLDCCFAASGELDIYDDVLACEGDADRLIPDWPPNYNGTPPDTMEYGFTYLVGNGDVLMEYDSTLDFTSFPPGVYQVCGLSYKRVDLDSFPNPDGIITISDIRDNLDGLEPQFCGEVTDSCVWIRIVPPPMLTELSATICEGDSVVVGDTSLVLTGIHDIILESYAGCDSIVRMDLTVIPTLYTDLVESICEGESFSVGSNAYSNSGFFVDTLVSSQNCDSIVRLQLSVLAPVFADVSAVICRGASFAIGDSLFTESGFYEQTILSTAGCDSTVRLNLQVLDVNASIAPPNALDCAQTTVLLNGSTSTPAGQISFSWQNTAGTVLGTGSMFTVSNPGTYILQVTQTVSGTQCSNRDTVMVMSNVNFPIADAGPRDTLTCVETTLTVGGAGTSIGAEFAYVWSGPSMGIVGPNNQITALVQNPGTYTLIVTNTQNFCRDTATVIIAQDENVPNAVAGADTSLTCVRTSIELDGTASSMGAFFTYDWISTTGIVPLNPNTLMPTVNEPGLYRLLVLNTDNGCQDSAFVQVALDNLHPNVVIAPPLALNCELAAFELDASASDSMSNFSIVWTPANGGNIAAGQGSLSPLIDAPGSYELTIVNETNGCSDSASVEVIETSTAVVAMGAVSDTLSCAINTVTLTASGSSTGGDIVFSWTALNGQFPGELAAFSIDVNQGGTYQLVVLDTFALCSDTLVLNVVQDTIAPFADAGPDRFLTCDSLSVTLDGSASSAGMLFDYLWFNADTVNPVDAGNPNTVVSEAAEYLLIVINTENGCSDTSFVQVAYDTLYPTTSISQPLLLNCELTEFELDASGSDSGADFSIQWVLSDGANIVSGDQTLTPLINATGNYELVIVNTVNGCTSSALVAVQDTVNQIIADAGINDTLTCDVTSITLSAALSIGSADAVYCWSSADGHFTSDSIAVQVAVDAPGIYQLIVKDTVTFCADTSFVQVFQDTISPLVDAGVGFEIDCINLQDTLQGFGAADAPIQYAWTGPCIISPSNTPEITVNCAGTYYLSITNQTNACTATDSVLVTQNPSIPIAAILDDPNHILSCDSLTITLDASLSSQGDSICYQWGGPGILSGDTTLYPVVNEPGQYDLLVTNKNSNCTSVATVFVVQDTLVPIADSDQIDLITCDSLVVEIGGFTTSMGDIFAYEWTTTNGNFVSPTNEPFVLVDTAGIYELTVFNTFNGCASSSVAEVFQDTHPPIAHAGDDQIIDCGSPQVVLSNSGSTTGGNINYEWSGPNCITGEVTANEIIVDCPGLFFLTVSNENTGCFAVDTVAVMSDPSLPIAFLPTSLELSCETSTVIIDASASNGAVFTWYFNGMPSSLSGLMPEVNEAGIYTLVASNANQDCSDTSSVVVALDCIPDIVVATPDTLTCLQTSVFLDASASSSGSQITFNWVVPNASCIESGQGTPVLEVKCPGIYQLIVTNQLLQLSDTASVLVVQNTTPPIADAAIAPMITCTEPASVLDVGNSSSGTNIGYSWTLLGDENFIAFGPTVQVLNDGTYFLTVIDSLNGCTAEDIVDVPVSDDVPVIAFGGTVIPCLRDTFRLQAFVTPENQPYEYTWMGNNILADGNTLSVLLDTAGVDTLMVVNTSNNCVAFAVVTVTQQTCIPCLEIAPVDTLNCVRDTVQISAAFCESCIGCAVQWQAVTGSIAAQIDSMNVLVDAPGLYRVTATDTLGFSKVVEIVVPIDTMPPLANAGLDQELTCGVSLAGLGDEANALPHLQFQWSASSGLPITPDNGAYIEVDFPDTFELLVTNTLNGCTAVDEVVVTVDRLTPFADAGPGQLLTCDINTLSLDGSNSTFGVQIAYQWDGPSGADIIGANTFNPIIDTPGWYFLTVTNLSNQCYAIDSTLVDQADDVPPVPSLPDTALTCAFPVILLEGSIPDGSNYEYEWCRVDEDGMPLGSCIDMLLIEVGVVGTYRFEISNPLTGCSNSVLVEVTENFEEPEAEAGESDTLLCNLDSLQLNGSAGPIGQLFGYEWFSFAGNPISDPNLANPYIYEPGVYQLTVTNLANGCTDTDQVTIDTDETTPFANAGLDTTLTCSRDQLRLLGSGTTDSGQITVQWESEEGSILLGSNTFEPLINAPGAYILMVMDEANGCTATDTVLVASNTQTPLAAIDSMGMELNCQTDEIEVDASTSEAATPSGLSFEWQKVPGEVVGINDQISLTEIGNYLLIVTDQGNGCSDSLSFAVSADYISPEVEIAAAEPITCTNQSVALDASASSNGANFINTWIGPEGDTLSFTDLQPSVMAGGSYRLVIFNTSNGCQNFDVVNVPVDTTQPVVLIRTPENLDCMVRSVWLDGSLSSTGNGLTYSWTSNQGAIAGPMDAPLTMATAPGWYVLTLFDNENGCMGQDSIAVIELAVPIETAVITATPPTCDGSIYGSIRIDSVNGGSPPYLFSLEGEGYVSVNPFEYIPPGTYALSIQDSNGCEWETDITVPESMPFEVNLSPDPTVEIVLGDSAELKIQVSISNIDSIWWLPELPASDGISLSQYVSPQQSTAYQVFVMDDLGCIASDVIWVTVVDSPTVFVPNIFSPNGDNSNDRLVVFGGSNVSNIAFWRIFDRWGNLVHEAKNFQPNDPNYGWDGNFNGSPLDPAVFVYYLEVVFANGQTGVLEGDVLLMR
ncbi:MAG TPA: gliding motility-associated C-terminal domain-containing protein [Saprospiraceae bacterium]|nr:gliding motility-associated C-terminal domain-containing protein [Saprospiraceae bacterium]HMQ83125.1 gliding motility-associated C-terminal domain-containing protein [Saprospiraceae bacterium]